MSATSARSEDPRVLRTRSAVLAAATTLFLRQGYSGTSMEEIASLAGITKRTIYNNFRDKETLFTQMANDVISYAEGFAHGLPSEFARQVGAGQMHDALHDLGQRLALSIVRPEVITLRRLLIGEARLFPELATEYYDRAPARVLAVIAERLQDLADAQLLQILDSRTAAAQFAYLVVGEPLDRAVMTGTIPPRERILETAREGVETFLARYAFRGDAG